MKIHEVARLTGVTVRTLQYYDTIGLLKPSEITDAGYRLYDASALERLQQVLFFKELDFSLTEIKQIITNPHYDSTKALQNHKQLLLQKRNRLDALIGLVDNTLKGEKDMSFEQFDRAKIEEHKKKYAAEVNERWGDTAAYAESAEKTKDYSDAQWGALSDEGAAIMRAFSAHMQDSPDSPAVQSLVQQWQAYITAHFYQCTKEILSCLGQMYVGDERFTQNIDQNGAGTAAFMARAIAIYCAQ